MQSKRKPFASQQWMETHMHIKRNKYTLIKTSSIPHKYTTILVSFTMMNVAVYRVLLPQTFSAAFFDITNTKLLMIMQAIVFYSHQWYKSNDLRPLVTHRDIANVLMLPILFLRKNVGKFSLHVLGKTICRFFYLTFIKVANWRDIKYRDL